MNRTAHRHGHGGSRALRLLLARHTLNRADLQQAVAEHGDCADCWRETALAAVDDAKSLLLSLGPLPEMDSSGLATGPTADWLLRRLAVTLDAEADRGA
jgi:hypothetical protein